MQKLIYKIKISDGAIYAIDKLGGIQLAEKYLSINKSFSGVSLISDEIKRELQTFFLAKSSPPVKFKRFQDILHYYYNSENKLTKEKLNQVIGLYNSSINLSFEEFYNSLLSLTERELKEKYKIGGITSFKINSILKQTYELNELLNSLKTRETFGLDYKLLTQTVDDYIIQETFLNNELLKSILTICQDYNIFLNFLTENELLSYIESSLSEIEISKFRICTSNLIKCIYLLKHPANSTSINSSNDELKAEIKNLHSTLLNKYAELVELTQDENIIRKSKLKSKIENISKLFIGFEQF